MSALAFRRFVLWRKTDVSGVSGTGAVANGVQFPDGAVVVRWRGETPTTTVHENIASVERVHLHGGATVILWLDANDSPVWLGDGWREPNGVVDHAGADLRVGMRVKLRRLFGEIAQQGEIISFRVAETGGIYVGIFGCDCGPTDYPLDEIEAIETPEETRARGKPSFGWTPAIKIGGAS